jgi:hypothetical protein
VISGCFLAVGTLIGARYGGEGVAAGFSIGAALAIPAYLYVLSKQLLTPVRVIAREIVAPLVATLAMAVVVTALLRKLPAWDPLLQLVVLAVCGLLSFTLVLTAISGRRLLADLQWLLTANRDVGSGLVGGTPNCE